MNKELARYFVKLIVENLQFSFNGMGIPSYSCEWLENQLMQGNFDEVKEFIQKRYDELENASKPKRKFRAMTNAEFCDKWQAEHNNHCSGKFELCPLFFMEGCEHSNKPYTKANGKYILIEVTNDA